MASFARDLKELIRLAAPVVGTRLGVMVMGLIDTVVVGRFSPVQLGYMALGWAPTMVIVTTAIGMLSGVQVMTARRMGEGRTDQLGPVLRRGLVYALALGLAATVLLLLAGPPLLRVSGVGPDLARGAAPVLRVVALSTVTALMAVAGSNWLEALGRPGQAMAAMWLANAVNLGLDLVLVPGGFGLAPMGAVGAAWSTFAARLVLVAATAVFVIRAPEARGLFARLARDRPAEIEQRRIGYAAGAAFFVETAAFSGMNVVAGWAGHSPWRAGRWC